VLGFIWSCFACSVVSVVLTRAMFVRSCIVVLCGIAWLREVACDSFFNTVLTPYIQFP